MMQTTINLSNEELLLIVDKCLGCNRRKRYVFPGLSYGFCPRCMDDISNIKKIELILQYFESLAKPWKDPNSLFCSPNLKDIIGKEPMKGKECKQ